MTFADGSTEVFDRVVTRYGPGGSDVDVRLMQGALRDSYPGNILLADAYYFLPGETISESVSTQQRIEPARDQVRKRLSTIERRRATIRPIR